VKPLTAAPTVAVLLYAPAKSEENRTLFIASVAFVHLFRGILVVFVPGGT
jgi:hypothetical protein